MDRASVISRTWSVIRAPQIMAVSKGWSDHLAHLYKLHQVAAAEQLARNLRRENDNNDKQMGENEGGGNFKGFLCVPSPKGHLVIIRRRQRRKAKVADDQMEEKEGEKDEQNGREWEGMMVMMMMIFRVPRSFLLPLPRLFPLPLWCRRPLWWLTRSPPPNGRRWDWWEVWSEATDRRQTEEGEVGMYAFSAVEKRENQQKTGLIKKPERLGNPNLFQMLWFLKDPI